MILKASFSAPDDEETREWLKSHIDETLFLSSDKILFDNDTTEQDANEIVSIAWGNYRSFLVSFGDRMQDFMNMAEKSIGTKDVLYVSIGYLLHRERDEVERSNESLEELFKWVDSENLDEELEFSYFFNIIPKINDKFITVAPNWFVTIIEDMLYFRETVIIEQKTEYKIREVLNETVNSEA